KKRQNSSKVMSEGQWNIAKRNAKKIIRSITQKNLILIIVSLYWAEGAKKDFSFSNTDPRMIRIFIHVLKKVFGISDNDFKISIRVYEDLDKNECVQYWLKISGLKHELKDISVNELKGSKKGKLKYGMCRVRVKKGGLLLKKFISIISRIDNLIGSRSSIG
ncbi:MAG: hypothetical protein Q7S77_01890, partial [Candidatus Staskawiczbacteria bacterium]|nr:hypothetical protein [Candidatus Staskawiczbacteria bacterium]